MIVISTFLPCQQLKTLQAHWAGRQTIIGIHTEHNSKRVVNLITINTSSSGGHILCMLKQDF